MAFVRPSTLKLLARHSRYHRCLTTTTTSSNRNNMLPPYLTFQPSTSSSAATTGTSPLPAVIVLQEWWGINDQIKNHAKHIADMTGAETVVPDLYKGKLGLNAEEASHLMNNLDFKLAVQEIESLCNELRKDSTDRKIGVTGFW